MKSYKNDLTSLWKVFLKSKDILWNVSAMK